MSDMAKFNFKLPRHCRAKPRKGYYDVYFEVHIKDRPHGWPASIRLGRTDKDSIKDIIAKGEIENQRYLDFCAGYTPRAPEGSFEHIITIYRQSYHFKDLKDKTRKDYMHYLREIEEWSARNNSPHISMLNVKNATRWLNTFEEKPVKQKRMRSICSILANVAITEGYIERNVFEYVKLRTRQTEKRKVVIWSEEDIDRFIDECDARGLSSLGSIALTMIETSQRKGDVLTMQRGKNYTGGKLIYIQSKTGKKVAFNTTKKLQMRYDSVGIGDFMMFINENTGKPWTGDNVTHRAREILDYLGMNKHILMHLRHSQVYHLYELGHAYNEIAAITGHSEDTIKDMLNRHYLEIRNEETANRGIAKIDEARKSRTKSRT